MVTKPEKGKYLTLEDVRIHYDENKDSIVLTSKDKDIPEGKSIYLNLNNGRGAEKVLREMLQNAGIIESENFKNFPDSISYDAVPENQPWYAFPLGVRPNGNTVFWDPNTTGSLLVWGQGDFGKENADASILRHCVNNSDHWTVSVIDYRARNTNKYSQYRPVVEKIAKNTYEVADIIDNAYDQMQARKDEMEATGVSSYLELDSKPPAHLVMIDDIGVQQIENFKNMKTLYRLGNLLQGGRTAGIHVVISGRGMGEASRIVAEEFLRLLPSRLITGKVEYLLSQWMLGNGKASNLGEVKARSYFQEFGKGVEIQAYEAESPEWVGKRVENNS
jgi:hypothetical protein